MPLPPNHVMADRLAAKMPVYGYISHKDALRLFFREFGATGLRAEAVIQIARLRDQIEVGHGGATISRKVSHG